MSDWSEHPTLPGSHVRLEPLSPDHAKGLFEAAQDPGIWSWMSQRMPEDVPAAELMVETALAEPGRFAWAQIDVASGRVAGSTSYYQIVANHRILSIGHTWLGADWQRTALNTEAKFLLLRNAFEVLGAQRVAWETDSRNLRSQRAIERLGALREGRLVSVYDGSNRHKHSRAALLQPCPGRTNVASVP